VLNNHIAADFTATPLSGVAPLEVSFTNTTYNSYPSGNYLWTFGDGNTSTLTNPIHTYTAVGLYTVSLSGYYSTNYSIRTKNDYITVGNFVPATGVLPQFQSVAGGKILEPPRRRQNVLDPIDPHKRRDETIGSLTGSSPTQTGTGKGGRYNKHGYVPGAFMFNTAIKQMRDHVEFEKFLCRTLKDDERTKQFKKNTQEHPESRYRLIYNNEAVEDHTAAGKKKRRDANRRQESQ
jgi:PKD repeat protein